MYLFGCARSCLQHKRSSIFVAVYGIFSCNMQTVSFGVFVQFTDQGSNSDTLHQEQILSHWMTREVPKELCSIRSLKTFHFLLTCIAVDEKSYMSLIRVPLEISVFFLWQALRFDFDTSHFYHLRSLDVSLLFGILFSTYCIPQG